MRPLTSEDPRAVGEYRTLVRLGAGGMGVVYLARSPGGELAALKVIRAEHAADPGFRARFRREAEVARRIAGPWVVPVTGADTEAREPWLATKFVPGPSLAEAVDVQGPLPVSTVRALGARLAVALAAVHEAGLVHRDVKPGNVLLALDGPRLIDFGIARHDGATALTATGAVIGTPGFLAPEQASAGESGPAGDVFSLGCVLVYAATGHRPFGQGVAAGVLFRTVHEDPDLDGLPGELLGTVTACLAKDPADRPTAAQAAERLADPGETAWSVPGLPALIAERSSAALTLPDPEPLPTVVDPAPARQPSRRRVLVAGAAGAVLLSGGGTAAWLAGRREDASGGRSPASGPRPTHTIGLHADMSGPGRATGLAHQRGAQLAVAAHNARTDAPFRLALRTEDDTGTTEGALRVAGRLSADPKVLAVVGPTTDRTPGAVVTRYGESRLAAVVVAAGTFTDLETSQSVCVIRPLDEALPTGLIHYVVHVRPARRIHVIEDGADPAGSWPITDVFRDVALTGATVTVHTVKADDGFGPAARSAVSARADTVVYAGGLPTRGARCARALADAGFTGTPLSTGPVLAPAFLRDAGDAGEGWVFSEAYTDPSAAPAAKAFTVAHRARFDAPPGRWSAEAYDAVGLIARAAETTSATDAERGGVAQRLLLLDHQGISRRIAFHGPRLVRSETGMFLYRIEDGRARWLGPYAKV
ncbi:bifunctional serine/threonine-protein kinase/ABC transporter substrate-binding protein [Streptomyces sp. NBC_01102]|uniref:bifunctional serine/threonine-protein kinase/ABC transporter substrate-binding protein n=1 Tax=unclassified Streptomyces TaxID=2593676 RepID=UPI0038637DDC|nr:bifunctional serine/threonine-protein kinase/ABC transporter substrate-binding protein [Streptomyces sp. NBC_01102]